MNIRPHVITKSSFGKKLLLLSKCSSDINCEVCSHTQEILCRCTELNIEM